MQSFSPVVAAIILGFSLTPAPADPAPRAETTFPQFDYEVICYAQNVFVQGGGALANIDSCRKEEEDARDLTHAVWGKMWPEAKSSCAGYAKGFARGSYRRLQECVANSLLLSLRDDTVTITK